jgi:hypothetical protein
MVQGLGPRFPGLVFLGPPLAQFGIYRHPDGFHPARFRLGIEAARLGLAYQYDPYFSLSISRVDPLPHQLDEANLQEKCASL